MDEKSTEPRKLSRIEKKLPAAWIDKIFKRLHGRFGNAFTLKFQTGKTNADGIDEGIANAKEMWAEMLADFTAEEISRGLLTIYQYPPSLDDFVKACRAGPDYEAAYFEAITQMEKRAKCQDVWSDPAIFWAAARLGVDLMTNPYTAIKNRWKAALDSVRVDIKDGKLTNYVPERKTMLNPPPNTKLPKEEAKKKFAELYAILGV